MQTTSPANSPPVARKTGRTIIVTILLLALAVALWFWRENSGAPQAKMAPVAVPVVSAEVVAMDVPVRLSANGTVSAVQSVDIHAQISATIRAVHVREGQFVRRGDRLFSLDIRSEEANLGKAVAQLAKSRADLANAERNLRRQRELFSQNFISQTALDAVQNQVDSLSAQVAADQAVVESGRVARGHGEIVAPIAGRIGAVGVYPGSLVQPSGPPLVGITQIDPINVSFTLPERELPELQQSLAQGEVVVTAQLDNVGDGGDAGRQPRQGRLVFIDNSVDSGSGTIRLKANFANADSRLWPGMFVDLALSPRTLKNALTVPAQAVQTGPEQKFLYLIDAANKVQPVAVRVLLVQDGLAAIEPLAANALAAGARVVVEGAQHLRPGSQVSEGREAAKTASPKPNKT